MADPLKLPPGATLVEDDGGMRLPPGATLVSDQPPAATVQAKTQASESTAGKLWRGANTPLIPEGRAEREGHEVATSAPTLSESDHPLVAAGKRFVAGTYADTMETARGFTSPLALATLGLGALGKAPGAVGKVATAASRLAGAGFGAAGGVEAVKGAADASKKGVTPENAKQMLQGAGQAVMGATATAGEGGQKTLTEKIPERLMNQLMRPAAADVKFGKNPARAILQEKITGGSLPEMGDKVYEKIQSVGKEIDKTLQKPANAAKQVDVAKSLKPIDDAMVKATQDGDRGLYVRLAELKQQLTMNWKAAVTKAGNQTIQPSGPRNLQMSPYDATLFKRVVGDSTRWTGNDPFEDRLNAVKGEIYVNIKEQVNQAVPEVAPLNERYSNLVGAGKAIERRIPIAERNAHWSLTDVALGASGHIPLAILRKLSGAPAVSTRAGVLLSGLKGGVASSAEATVAGGTAAALASRKKPGQ